MCPSPNDTGLVSVLVTYLLLLLIVAFSLCYAQVSRAIKARKARIKPLSPVASAQIRAILITTNWSKSGGDDEQKEGVPV